MLNGACQPLARKCRGFNLKHGRGTVADHQRIASLDQAASCRRAGDPLAERQRVPLRGLAGHRLILLRGNPAFGQNFMEAARGHDVQITALHVADDFPSRHRMVLAGIGIAPCGLLLAEMLAVGLVARPLQPALRRLEIHAILRGRVPPAAAARWVEFLGSTAS